MTFTPSATSSFTAGALFWSMVWAGVGKLDQIVRFLGFKNRRPRRMVVRWINSHKVIALTITEAVNYGVHGITNPLGVTFALGGTIVNVFMILFIVPIWSGLSALINGKEVQQ